MSQRSARVVGAASGALCLLLGLVFGAVGAKLSDKTPFSHSDLAQARSALGPTQGLAEQYRKISRTTSGKLEEAEAEVSRLRTESSQHQREVDQDRKRIHNLQDQIRVLRNQSTNPEVPDTSTGTIAGEPKSLVVTGTLESTWVLTSELKPWPAGCDGVLKSYQVKVNTGDHATVTVAQLTGSRLKRRSVKQGILELTCVTTYRATIPDASGPVYEIQAVEASEPDKPLQSSLVQASKLAGGHGPDLYTSFCPSCTNGH